MERGEGRRAKGYSTTVGQDLEDNFVMGETVAVLAGFDCLHAIFRPCYSYSYSIIVLQSRIDAEIGAAHNVSINHLPTYLNVQQRQNVCLNVQSLYESFFPPTFARIA